MHRQMEEGGESSKHSRIHFHSCRTRQVSVKAAHGFWCVCRLKDEEVHVTVTDHFNTEHGLILNNV